MKFDDADTIPEFYAMLYDKNVKKQTFVTIIHKNTMNWSVQFMSTIFTHMGTFGNTAFPQFHTQDIKFKAK
jgi:hypothetical protein